MWNYPISLKHLNLNKCCIFFIQKIQANIPFHPFTYLFSVITLGLFENYLQQKVFFFQAHLILEMLISYTIFGDIYYIITLSFKKEAFLYSFLHASLSLFSPLYFDLYLCVHLTPPRRSKCIGWAGGWFVLYSALAGTRECRITEVLSYSCQSLVKFLLDRDSKHFFSQNATLQFSIPL